MQLQVSRTLVSFWQKYCSAQPSMLGTLASPWKWMTVARPRPGFVTSSILPVELRCW